MKNEIRDVPSTVRMPMYVCEICETEHFNAREALECENKHSEINEIIRPKNLLDNEDFLIELNSLIEKYTESERSEL